jgi:hypothetical protein
MENQFYAEFVRNALCRMDENDRDLGFYDGIDLNKKSTN